MKGGVFGRQISDGGRDTPLHFIELAPPACDCSHVSSPMCAVSINHVIVNPAGHINSHPGWKTVLMV